MPTEQPSNRRRDWNTIFTAVAAIVSTFGLLGALVAGLIALGAGFGALPQTVKEIQRELAHLRYDFFDHKNEHRTEYDALDRMIEECCPDDGKEESRR